MTRVIAIDWSGARSGAERRIWIAEAVDGRLELLEDGRTRGEVADWLVQRRLAVPQALVGVDFAFSYPAWFLDRLGCRQTHDLWPLVAEQGERWLADCAPPFWGRPGVRRGDEAQLRACEEGWAVGGIQPKSVFQIGGAGAVGTGTIRGMPFLPQLRAAGWSIWPFDAVAPHLIAEIWPRLLTGPVAKSSGPARAGWLQANARQTGRLIERAGSSEDAFDAAASAIVLSRCADLGATLAAPLPGDPREGAMLVPPSVLNGSAYGTLP